MDVGDQDIQALHAVQAARQPQQAAARVEAQHVVPPAQGDAGGVPPIFHKAPVRRREPAPHA